MVTAYPATSKGPEDPELAQLAMSNEALHIAATRRYAPGSPRLAKTICIWSRSHLISPSGSSGLFSLHVQTRIVPPTSQGFDAGNLWPTYLAFVSLRR